MGMRRYIYIYIDIYVYVIYIDEAYAGYSGKIVIG